jgi:hypothetical protein
MDLETPNVRQMSVTAAPVRACSGPLKQSALRKKLATTAIRLETVLAA